MAKNKKFIYIKYVLKSFQAARISTIIKDNQIEKRLESYAADKEVIF